MSYQEYDHPTELEKGDALRSSPGSTVNSNAIDKNTADLQTALRNILPTFASRFQEGSGAKSEGKPVDSITKEKPSISMAAPNDIVAIVQRLVKLEELRALAAAKHWELEKDRKQAEFLSKSVAAIVWTELPNSGDSYPSAWKAPSFAVRRVTPVLGSVPH